MRTLHATLATLFMLGLAACDEGPTDSQTGQMPTQQQEQQPMQEQPGTGPSTSTGQQ